MARPLSELMKYLPSTFRKRLDMTARYKPIMVFPGIRSDDPTFCRMCFELHEELEKNLPRSEVINGIYQPPGSPGGWEKLMNVPGYSMNPSGTPNGKQAADVPQKWESKGDEAFFRLIVRTLFPHGEPADFKSRRDASTMHPFYSKDPGVKDKSLQAGLYVINTQLMSAYEANKPEELAVKFDFWYKHDKATREQVDGAAFVNGVWVPKEREVFDFDGQRVKANKALRLPGVDVPHWASRSRIAYGTSASANYPLVVLAACMRPVSYHAFPETYHHGSAVDIQNRLASHPEFIHALPMDVKNFDQNQGRHFINAFLEELPLDPRARLHATLVSRAPVGANEDHIGKSGYRSIGNPLDFSTFDLYHGNPSGWALNDLLNQAVGTFICCKVAQLSGAAIFITQDGRELEPGAEERLRAVLEWKHPAFAFQNKGDDSVLWFTSSSQYQVALGYLSKRGRIYLEVELEQGARFLGNVYVQDGERIVVLPDITSLLIRELKPEYGWGSAKRPYAAHGHFERQRYYARHPKYPEAHAIVERVFAKYYGVGLDAYLKGHVVKPEGIDLLNYAEAEFMVNPAAIHYKINIEDIRPGLQEKFFVHVTWEKLAPQVRGLFTSFNEERS